MLTHDIYVVDDDQDVAASLTLFLSSAGYSPRSFSDGSRFLACAKDLHPGCLLLDVRMPEVDGFDVLVALGELRNRFGIIVMTGHGDVATAVKAMKAGATDFIEKPFEEILAIRAIARANEFLEHRVRMYNRQETALQQISALTPRELDVLKGMIEGRPNKLLAYDLDLSVRTIEAHRANMMDRLGATSAAQVIRLAFDAGMIDRRATTPVRQRLSGAAIDDRSSVLT